MCHHPKVGQIQMWGYLEVFLSGDTSKLSSDTHTQGMSMFFGRVGIFEPLSFFGAVFPQTEQAVSRKQPVTDKAVTCSKGRDAKLKGDAFMVRKPLAKPSD